MKDIDDPITAAAADRINFVAEAEERLPTIAELVNTQDRAAAYWRVWMYLRGALPSFSDVARGVPVTKTSMDSVAQALSLGQSTVARAYAQLKKDGVLVQIGEKKGSRYMIANTDDVVKPSVELLQALGRQGAAVAALFDMSSVLSAAELAADSMAKGSDGPLFDAVEPVDTKRLELAAQLRGLMEMTNEVWARHKVLVQTGEDDPEMRQLQKEAMLELARVEIKMSMLKTESCPVEDSLDPDRVVGELEAVKALLARSHEDLSSLATDDDLAQQNDQAQAVLDAKERIEATMATMRSNMDREGMGDDNIVGTG